MHQQIQDVNITNCKVKYRFLIDDDGKPLDIVSNHGLKKYERSYVARNGEYSGFCVEAQESIPSVLTNKHISDALKHLQKGDTDKAASSINMYSQYQMYGETVIYYVIDEWLKTNKFEQMFQQKIDKEFLNSIKDIKESLDVYVATQRHHPINGKIKIVDIGTNTKTKESVVPPEWIGKVFDSGTLLHKAMDSLPYRKGKPPVSYCCIYSNSIKRETTWLSDHTLRNGDRIYKIYPSKQNSVLTQVIRIDKKTIYGEKLLRLYDKNLFIQIDDQIINRSDSYTKNMSVGYLSSLLQKCIRRGPDNGSLLEEVMSDLNNSPSYNLPDHNFALVSGSRQLVWRSFISIVEDAKGYTVSDKSADSVDMLTMCLLAIACQIDPAIKLTDIVMKPLIKTMRHIQACDQKWIWRDYDHAYDPQLSDDVVVEGDNELNSIRDAVVMSLRNMPMMANDRDMLLKVHKYLSDPNNSCQSIEAIKIAYPLMSIKDQDMNAQQQTRATGMDMHCKPTMLIELQGMLNLSIIPKKSLSLYIPTLSTLSHYIWNNFSRINFRDRTMESSTTTSLTASLTHTPIYSDKEIKRYQMDKRLVKLLDNEIYRCVSSLQNNILADSDKRIPKSRESIDWFYSQKIMTIKDQTIIDQIEKSVAGRTAWLAIFGKRYRFSFKNRMYDIFFGGSDRENLCKIKKTVQGRSEYVEGDLRTEIQDKFLETLSWNKQHIKLPNPPENYRWRFNSKSVTILYDKDSDKFFIDDEEVTTLDLSDQIIRVTKCVETVKIPDELSSVIKTTLYQHDSSDDFGEDILRRLGDMAYYRRLYDDHRVFGWADMISSDSNSGVWRLALARLYTSDIDGQGGRFILNIGPCDRRGKKTNNSINYQFEGVLYRIFTLMSVLYPFMMKRINQSMRWTVDRTMPEYHHMIESMKKLSNDESLNKETIADNKNIDKDKCDTKQTVQIITPLWEHQEKTSLRIFKGLTVDRKRGFGDASHVGSGKTLCALSLLSRLHHYNINRSISTSSGFLIMLPSIQLIKTWTDEVEKHTKGFDTLIQESDGDFLRCSDKKKISLSDLVIKSNTLIITTMGRMRDHPVQHSWIVLVIDECLTVQNKEALQTEEAWRQSCYSEHGVVMLSATFFRSRFDKMLYMIKMLKTGLPEERDYLDAILNESIVSNITESDRTWKIITSRIDLDVDQREAYESIYKENSNKGSETLFIALAQYIHDKINYIDLFYDQLEQAEKENRRVLIFTKSKNEATLIVESKRNKSKKVTRYPEKGEHTVLSLTEGTYGLNDLVIYDTILMRPPEPDKLPQIKGRLDRPGQLSKDLQIRYLLLKDTIEEASILRLELCNTFYNNYLMPLAEFYDLAIKHQSLPNVDAMNLDQDQESVKIPVRTKKVKSNPPKGSYLEKDRYRVIKISQKTSSVK